MLQKVVIVLEAEVKVLIMVRGYLRWIITADKDMMGSEFPVS